MREVCDRNVRHVVQRHTVEAWNHHWHGWCNGGLRHLCMLRSAASWALTVVRDAIRGSREVCGFAGACLRQLATPFSVPLHRSHVGTCAPASMYHCIMHLQHVWVCMHMHIYIYIYLYPYLYMYVCMYVCIYIYIYLYIYIIMVCTHAQTKFFTDSKEGPMLHSVTVQCTRLS